MRANKRNLLIFRLRAENKLEIVGELKLRGWNVLLTDQEDIGRQFIEKSRAAVGIAYFYSEDPRESVEQISLIRSYDCVKWVALLDRLPVANTTLSSIIYSYCYDFLTRPFDIERLLFSIGHAYGLAMLEKVSLLQEDRFDGRFGMLGRSPVMQELFSIIEKVSASDEFVMIQGQTGTGKELIARAIHDNSSRKNKPFVPINCATLSKDLLFSELFGHAKGAFTDAYQDTQGLLGSANGGTVFFDEVGELKFEQQAALLRFLQEQTFYRLGEMRLVRVNVRVLSATNRNLNEAVKIGNFRSDLFYRINVLAVTSPPLRDRGNDAFLIARFMLNKAAKAKRLGYVTFSKDAINAINSYSWPGNVRELIHRVNRAVALSAGQFITARDLDLEVVTAADYASLKEIRELAEANAIRFSLLKTGNVAYSAKALGVSRVTLYRLLNKYGIGLPD